MYAIEETETILNGLVYDIYHLTEADRQLIEKL